MATIALLSTGMRGHLAPLARLGRVLGRQGHRLRAWVPAELSAEMGAAGATVHEHEPVPVRRPFLDLRQLAGWLAEGTERCVGELIEALDREGVGLVIHDVHVPWARVAADFLGLPRAVTTPLFPPALEAGEMGGQFLRAPGLDSPPQVREASERVARRWGVELGGWTQVVWSPGETVLNFSTAEVTGRPERAPAWTYVGPLLSPPPPREARGDRARVYVSFGTFFNLPPTALRLTLAALGERPLDVVAATGRTAVGPDELGPQPAGVAVHEFVDGRAELARADVFVTHGGCSSVHEALLAGVPMVCLPHGADQFDWSRRVQELGAGLVVGFDAAQIGAATERVLTDPGYAARSREIGEQLSAFDGPERVDEAIDGLLG